MYIIYYITYYYILYIFCIYYIYIYSFFSPFFWNSFYVYTGMLNCVPQTLFFYFFPLFFRLGNIISLIVKFVDFYFLLSSQIYKLETLVSSSFSFKSSIPIKKQILFVSILISSALAFTFCLNKYNHQR